MLWPEMPSSTSSRKSQGRRCRPENVWPGHTGKRTLSRPLSPSPPPGLVGGLISKSNWMVCCCQIFLSLLLCFLIALFVFCVDLFKFKNCFYKDFDHRRKFPISVLCVMCTHLEPCFHIIVTTKDAGIDPGVAHSAFRFSYFEPRVL